MARLPPAAAALVAASPSPNCPMSAPSCPEPSAALKPCIAYNTHKLGSMQFSDFISSTPFTIFENSEFEDLRFDNTGLIGCKLSQIKMLMIKGCALIRENTCIYWTHEEVGDGGDAEAVVEQALPVITVRLMYMHI